MTLKATSSTDPANGVVTVELHGLLDLASAPTLRTVLLKSLAQCPDAIIVDVSDLRVETRSRLAVFPAAVHAHGPSATLLICGADAQLAEQAAGGVLGGLPTYSDRKAALSAIAAAEVPGVRRMSLRLGPTPRAAKLARDLVSTACREWGLDALRGPAGLVVSELVSNAVQHAGTELVVRVTRHGTYLHLSVHDGSSRMPRTAHGPADEDPAALADRGRGLHLVESYSTAWGSRADRTGKTVWATLRSPEPA